MADETAPAAPPPDAPSPATTVEPGPVSTSGTSPEPSAAEVTAAPAVSSEDTPAATSILSEAKPTEGETLAEKPAEAKEESVAEEKPAEVKPAEPLPAPTYEPFTLPEGVTLDDEKLGSFTTLLGEYENRLVSDPTQAHAVVQEMGQKLVDTFVAEMRDHDQRLTRLQRDNWDRTQERWQSEFREDPDIGGNRQQTTVARMGALLTLYGQSMGGTHEQAARDAFGFTGAGNNPAVLRFVNWAASRLVEAPRPVPAVVPRPVPATTTRAQRLYRNTPGAA